MKLQIRMYKEIEVKDGDGTYCAETCPHLEFASRDPAQTEFFPRCHLFGKTMLKRLHPDKEVKITRCAPCLHTWDSTDPGPPTNCHDCNAAPGECHKSGCDTEQCSVCGGQWIACGHEAHDPQFARWSGWWPGKLESIALGIDLNKFHSQGWAEKLFVKPKLPKD